MKNWVSLFRPGDLVKNIFVLLPMVFWLSSQGRDTPADVVGQKWGALAWAFIAFCVTASGTYAMNDALDAAEDRKHPLKRMRPVASGAIGAPTALSAGVFLVMAGSLIAWSVNADTGVIVLSYVGLQLLYNLYFKVTPFVDVAIVASGFCLRAAAGATSISRAAALGLNLLILGKFGFRSARRLGTDGPPAVARGGSDGSPRTCRSGPPRWRT